MYLNLSSLTTSSPHHHQGKGSHFHKGTQKSVNSVVLNLGKMLELLEGVYRKYQSLDSRWGQLNQSLLRYSLSIEMFQCARWFKCVAKVDSLCPKSSLWLDHKGWGLRVAARRKDWEGWQSSAMQALQSMPRSLASVLEAMGAQKGF